MPWCFLRPFILGIQPLQAQDALYWSTVNLVGSNAMKKEDRRAMIHTWQRQARDGRPAADRPKGPAAALTAFAALGIPTAIVKPND